MLGLRPNFYEYTLWLVPFWGKKHILVLSRRFDNLQIDSIGWFFFMCKQKIHCVWWSKPIQICRLGHGTCHYEKGFWTKEPMRSCQLVAVIQDTEIHIYIYKCKYKYTHTHSHINAHLYIYPCAYAYTYTYIYIYRTYAYIHVHIHLNRHLHIQIHIPTHIPIHIHTHLQ